MLRTLSTKSIFMLSYFTFMVSCLLIFFSQDIFVILCLSASFGLLLTILNTLPYKMIFDFNETMLTNGEGFEEFRGVGFDCSVLSCSFFLAQMIVASTMSLFIYSFGNRVILLVGASASALGFFFCNSLLIYV